MCLLDSLTTPVNWDIWQLNNEQLDGYLSIIIKSVKQLSFKRYLSIIIIIVMISNNYSVKRKDSIQKVFFLSAIDAHISIQPIHYVIFMFNNIF